MNLSRLRGQRPHLWNFALASCLAAVVPSTARAQLGSGWIPTTFTKSIHLDDDAGLQTFSWSPYRSVCSPTVCADYTYDSSDDSETFRIFDSRSNRSEIRLQNNYSTAGRRQFEGYLTFYAPLHDESLFQIFGNTGSAATFLMMRGYRDNNGTIRVMGGSHTIATGVYGQEVRINIIHEYNVSAKFYVNGVFVHEKPHNDPGVVNYWKYGCYGTTSGNVPAIVKWRAVRTFRDGFAPGTDVSAAPDFVTVAQGGSSASSIQVAPFGATTTISVNGVPAGATAVLNPTSVGSGGGVSTLTINTTAGIATGRYPLTVTATGAGTNRTTTVNLGVLPPFWSNRDIGGPGRNGGASFSNGIFSVTGGGADIWNTADKFNFAYQNFSGDLTITARVVGQQNTHSFAKAGVMMRESTNANSKYVAMLVTPANGLALQMRSTAGASSVNVTGWSGSGDTPPRWVRLTRSGNTFTGFKSVDGVSWTQVVSTNLTMNSEITVGLAVTSHDDAQLNTATFSDVTMPSGFSLSATPPSQTIAVNHSGNWQVTLASLNGFADTVNLSASGLPAGVTAGFDPPSLSGNNSSTLTLATSGSTPAGSFPINIIGTSGIVSRTNTVTLVTTANLIWNSTSSTAWDTSTPNWFSEQSNSAGTFTGGSAVLLTDRPGVVTNLTIASGVSVTPSLMTVNAETLNYAISGAGKISGAGNLVKSGVGALTLSTVNDFTGKVFVQGGVLNISAENNLGANPAALAADQLTLDGGTLQTLTSFTIDDANRGITLGENGGRFDVVTNTLTIARAIGGGSVEKTGEGTLALNVANSYTGGSVATAGSFRANILGAYGYGPVSVSGSAVAYLNVNGTHTNDFNLAGNGPVEATGNFGAIRFANNNATATTLTGVITLTGDARISARGIAYSNPGGIIAGPITGEFALEFGNSGNTANPGRITLSNPGNDWAGDTTVFHGTLRLGAASVIPNGEEAGNVILFNSNPTNDSIFDLNGFNETINGLVSGGDIPSRCVITNSSATTATLTLGDNDADGVFSGVIRNGAGTVALIKIGAGTQTLSGNNTYTGTTTVLGGALVVNGSVGGAVVLVGGTTLSGNGAIAGQVTVNPDATISPGESLGALTISNNVTLRGFTRMELNAALGTNDVLRSATTISYGGTLLLTNLNGTLNASHAFKLFDAPTYSGVFTNLTPAIPGPNLAWNTNTLATDGTLRIQSVAPSQPPVIGTVRFGGGDFSFSGSNGPANASYYILATTNLALPLSNWTRIATNSFDENGNFGFTNNASPDALQQYYLLQLP